MVNVKTGNALRAVESAIRDLTKLDVTPSESRRIRALWRAKMLNALRREAVPAMRDATPKRTGQAARSIRAKAISRPVYGIEIGPGRRGFYLDFIPETDSLSQSYRDIVNDVWKRHNREALAEAVREVLNL